MAPWSSQAFGPSFCWNRLQSVLCVLCVACCQIFSKASDSCCCCSDSKTSVRPVGETHGMDSTKITVTNMRIIVEDQSKTAQGQMVCGTCWDCCKPCAECCCEACCGTKTIQSQERVRAYDARLRKVRSRLRRSAAEVPSRTSCSISIPKRRTRTAVRSRAVVASSTAATRAVLGARAACPLRT